MTFKQKLMLYLYSTPNIVGSLLGLVGLGLFFTDIINDYWLFIVIGLYGCGYFGTPRNEQMELSISRSLDTQAMIRSIHELRASVQKRLPKDVLEPLKDLCEVITQILPHLEKFDGTSHDLHAVKQTATDYLPNMLATYLQLPTAYAKLHVLKSGKTPADELTQQINLLNTEMHKVLENLMSNQTNELLAHGKFLEDKFSQGQDWLD